MLEIKETTELIDLYRQRMKALNDTINEKNLDNRTLSVVIDKHDFEYALNLMENEALKTPSNKALAKEKNTDLLKP